MGDTTASMTPDQAIGEVSAPQGEGSHETVAAPGGQHDRVEWVVRVLAGLLLAVVGAAVVARLDGAGAVLT